MYVVIIRLVLVRQRHFFTQVDNKVILYYTTLYYTKQRKKIRIEFSTYNGFTNVKLNYVHHFESMKFAVTLICIVEIAVRNRFHLLGEI